MDAAEALQRVHQLEPLLREHAILAEQERRLPDAVACALRAAGLYSLWAPRALGGPELDPISTFRVIEEISRVDSAAGWNVQISVGVQAFGAWLPKEGAEEIFTKDVILGGTLNPPAQLAPVAGATASRVVRPL